MIWTFARSAGDLTSYPIIRVRAALLKIKSTTYKLFFAIFGTALLLLELKKNLFSDERDRSI